MVSRSITAEELLLIPGSKHLELERGKLVPVSLAGFQHAVIASELARRIGEFATTRGLGVYFAAKIGFCIERDPDTVRAADGVFLRMERVRALGDHRGYVEGAPELAVEVLSPDDRRSDVLARCRAWVAAGSEMAVLVDPDQRNATVFTPGRETELDEHGVLRFEPVLPDLAVPVAKLFA